MLDWEPTPSMRISSRGSLPSELNMRTSRDIPLLLYFLYDSSLHRMKSELSIVRVSYSETYQTFISGLRSSSDEVYHPFVENLKIIEAPI